MHVFIDARGLENRVDGIGQFTLQIINGLPAKADHFFSVLCRDDLKLPLPTASNVTYIKTTLRRFSLRESHALSSLVALKKPDLYFNTSAYMPVKFKCKRIMMLYDLLSTHFKGNFKGMGTLKGYCARRYFRYQTKKSVMRADAIITISECSKKKISSLYGINESDINVVYGGVDKHYDFCADENKKREFAKAHDVSPGFFLHVGNLKPYKNIAGIINAYDCFIRKHAQARTLLAFTGNRGRGYDDAVRLITSLSLGDRIKMLGYIDVKDMPVLYSASMGLFFPSLEEGEGLPVLEAMCCKTPVVTSRGTATEEIAGGHAFLVDPKSPDSLVQGLEFLAFSPKDPVKINKAYNYAKEFTWGKTADAILRIVLKKDLKVIGDG
jgi:glycosyltransferase involved in cell wall biosynthesis